MNIHHLELFYYVASHGGISQSLPHLPYGVGQSAVSIQIKNLEEELGTTLFQRRPFALTPHGDTLLKEIRPFFQKIPTLKSKIAGVKLLRVGASQLILNQHLPHILGGLKKEEKTLQIQLREVEQHDAEEAILKGELDVAVFVKYREIHPQLQQEKLASLYPMLLVDRTLLGKTPLDQLPLISTETNGVVYQHFIKHLPASIQIQKTPSITPNTLEGVLALVKAGLGVGLSLELQPLKNKTKEKIEQIPLPTIPPLELFSASTNHNNPLVETLLSEAKNYIKTLSNKK
jgi:DNA-binding transcriptional LysR family regulator